MITGNEPINVTFFENGQMNGSGLTIREHFAALAMQGLLSQAQNEHPQNGNMEQWNYECIAKCAVKQADELINALNQNK